MGSSRRIRSSCKACSTHNNQINGLAHPGSHTIRSWGAIALGILLGTGTLVVLFWDVHSLSDITVGDLGSPDLGGYGKNGAGSRCEDMATAD